jgi:DNA sulfur modification protein DndE
MSFNRLRVTEKSTKYFASIKGRTGLTPNIISRMALCLSISDSSLLDSRLDDEKGQEFNRYTLLGEWDNFFIAMLKERLIHDGLDPDKELMPQFKAHLNRGVVMLFTRMKSLADVYDLIPSNSIQMDIDKNHTDHEEIDVKSMKEKKN